VRASLGNSRQLCQIHSLIENQNQIQRWKNWRTFPKWLVHAYWKEKIFGIRTQFGARPSARQSWKCALYVKCTHWLKIRIRFKDFWYTHSIWRARPSARQSWKRAPIISSPLIDWKSQSKSKIETTLNKPYGSLIENFDLNLLTKI